MASFKDSLDKFKKQQERCQSTVTSVASTKVATAMPRPAQPAVKFSSDTERLQHILSIRKSPVGSQIKRVVDLLLETRQALTLEQINEACYVDVKANRAVFDSLKDNPKVHYDGVANRFSYKAKHKINDKIELRNAIRKVSEGVPVADLRDAYPNVMDDLMALKDEGEIWLISNFGSQDDMVAYPNDPKLVSFKVDNDLKELFRGTDLPGDMIDVEKDLKKNGMKPATDTVERRRGLAQSEGARAESKPKIKTKKISKRTKLTNTHLPEIFGFLKN